MRRSLRGLAIAGVALLLGTVAVPAMAGTSSKTPISATKSSSTCGGTLNSNWSTSWMLDNRSVSKVDLYGTTYRGSINIGTGCGAVTKVCLYVLLSATSNGAFGSSAPFGAFDGFTNIGPPTY